MQFFQGKSQLPQGATIVKLVTTQAGQGKPTAIITSAANATASNSQFIGQVSQLHKSFINLFIVHQFVSPLEALLGATRCQLFEEEASDEQYL